MILAERVPLGLLHPLGPDVWKSTPSPRVDSRAWLATTHWGMVLKALEAGSLEELGVLNERSRVYRRPLYAFIRCQRHSPEAAPDLTC